MTSAFSDGSTRLVLAVLPCTIRAVNCQGIDHPDLAEHRPEAFSTRSDLQLKQRQTELAEADFREAVALAQKMSAKAWELRATTSLARLLAKQGRREEARTMLAEIYGWFTEGFDTADLRDAKTLLEELTE
jgi:hypothetical protein